MGELLTAARACIPPLRQEKMKRCVRATTGGDEACKHGLAHRALPAHECRLGGLRARSVPTVCSPHASFKGFIRAETLVLGVLGFLSASTKFSARMKFLLGSIAGDSWARVVHA